MTYENSVPALAEEYAQWMRRRSWDHFATFTFDTIVSSRTAEQYVTNTFIRHLERTTQRRVDYYGSIEMGRENERPHAHILLAGTAATATQDIAARWRRGLSTVEPFDPYRAGVWYVGKGLGDERTILLLRDYRNRN
jgi:hypothetical protein